MSRFLKNATFPILIVVVLAFFAQRFLGPERREAEAQLRAVPRPRSRTARSRASRSRRVTTRSTSRRSTARRSTRPAIRTTTSRGWSRLLRKNDVALSVKGKGGSSWLSLLTYILPFILLLGVLDIPDELGAGRRLARDELRQVARQAIVGRLAQGHVPRRGRRRRGGRGAARDQGVPREPQEVPGARRAHPQGRAAVRPARHRQDAARPRGRRRGRRARSSPSPDPTSSRCSSASARRRVRDLFEQAKQNSPCIIFMDEIDAVGRHRGAGLGGGHDEREQTLNQLLVEMDGFEMKDNIILIAATNRPDILDPALLRPGRFDRQVVVDRPDRKGRAQILEVHTRGKPLAKEIDLDNLAGQTPGFTGADLANLVNEAALLAARDNKREITQHELEEGIMRVIAGPEKKTRVMGEKERLVTAYHEMGHAMVAHFLEQHRPGAQDLDHLPRPGARLHDLAADRGQVPHHARRAGGHARDDAGRARRRGDRLREITTGAANDLEKVTATAKQMVMRFGMSEKLGPAHVRPRPVAAVPRPRVQRRRPTTRTRSRARSTTRSAASSRRRTRRARQVLGDRREAPRPALASCCSSTRRSSARSSRHCWPASPRKRCSARPSPRASRRPPRRSSRAPAARSPSRAPLPHPPAPASPAARRRCAGPVGLENPALVAGPGPRRAEFRDSRRAESGCPRPRRFTAYSRVSPDRTPPAYTRRVATTAARTYEQACAEHRWNVPARYNIAADVCDKHPRDKLAMVWEDWRGNERSVSWGELQDLAAKSANVLRDHGVERGDRVAMLLPPTPETAAMFFGTWKAGAILLSMSVLYGDEGIRHRITDSQAKVLVTNAENADRIDRDLVEHVIVLDDDLLADASTNFETVDTAADDPGSALLLLGHHRSRQGHPACPPLRARARGVRLLPRPARGRAVPRHGGVGLGGRDLAAARAVAARRRRSSCSSARAASTPSSSWPCCPSTGPRTCSRRPPRCAR